LWYQPELYSASSLSVCKSWVYQPETRLCVFQSRLDIRDQLSILRPRNTFSLYSVVKRVRMGRIANMVWWYRVHHSFPFEICKHCSFDLRSGILVARVERTYPRIIGFNKVSIFQMEHNEWTICHFFEMPRKRKMNGLGKVSRSYYIF
jgi:hypothetical protein